MNEMVGLMKLKWVIVDLRLSNIHRKIHLVSCDDDMLCKYSEPLKKMRASVLRILNGCMI